MALIYLVIFFFARVLPRNPILTLRPEGLYCPAGDFFIDPIRKVTRAVITHGHSDHARPGHEAYLTASDGAAILYSRLGKNISLETADYNETIRIGDARVRFHPAGHVLGSAQVSITVGGERWVVSGDYKRQPDITCVPFEPVKCHVFITESTFGLPIYQWSSDELIFEQINRWWADNAALGLTSILLAYSLGKTQRLLARLDPSIGAILVHPSAALINAAYQTNGVNFPAHRLPKTLTRNDLPGSIILMPPNAGGTDWLPAEGRYCYGQPSGWMTAGKITAPGVKPFVLSDHADWPSLLTTITATEAETVLVTHGFEQPLVSYLRQTSNIAAFPLKVIQEMAPTST